MFRSFRALTACLGLLGALSLGACVAPGAAPVSIPGAVLTDAPVAAPDGTVIKPSTVVGKIQAATVKACAFLPTANFLANVATTFTNYDEAVVYAQNIATGICAQVAPKSFVGGKYVSLQLEPSTRSIRGVPIQGRFVKEGVSY